MNEKTIWDFLMGKLKNTYGVAGLMGNLYAESGLRPDNLQNSYERKFGLTDQEYTRRVDSGTYTQFVNDQAGYGLAQWTFHTRKNALLDFARSRGTSIGDLQMQLDFLWKELSEKYPALVHTLQTTKSIREASNAVLFQFERPADQGISVQNTRASFGETYFGRYSGSAPAPAPFNAYMVKITASVLRVRTAPTTDSAIATKVRRGEVYTIIGEQNGSGRLKSGAGWISLKYTERV